MLAVSNTFYTASIHFVC